LAGIGLAETTHVDQIAFMKLQIGYPDSLPDLLQTRRPQFEAEARMAMAVKLCELKRLSSGLAARLAGVSRVEFLLGLHRYGVPMIAHEEAELASDVAHA
jgi:predicted HTH domain antitoxin